MNCYGTVWRKNEECGKAVVETLKRIETNDELQFIRQTAKITELIEKNASKEDILEISVLIRESNGEIISILENQYDKISNQLCTINDKQDRQILLFNKLLENVNPEIRTKIAPKIQEIKNETLSSNPDKTKIKTTLSEIQKLAVDAALTC